MTQESHYPDTDILTNSDAKIIDVKKKLNVTDGQTDRQSAGQRGL